VSVCAATSNTDVVALQQAHTQVKEQQHSGEATKIHFLNGHCLQDMIIEVYSNNFFQSKTLGLKFYLAYTIFGEESVSLACARSLFFRL
jgi:hypothetical protein